MAVLKGKEKIPKPPVVSNEGVIDLPPEFFIGETVLAIDIMFLESELFLHSVDLKLKGKSLVLLGTTRKSKVEDLALALKKIFRFYNKADIEITMVHVYNELRSTKKNLDKDCALVFNFSAPDEHVPDIERKNRVLQERLCVEHHC